MKRQKHSHKPVILLHGKKLDSFVWSFRPVLSSSTSCDGDVLQSAPCNTEATSPVRLSAFKV